MFLASVAPDVDYLLATVSSQARSVFFLLFGGNRAHVLTYHLKVTIYEVGGVSGSDAAGAGSLRTGTIA